MTRRFSCLFLAATLFIVATKYHVTSSPTPQSNPPAAPPALLPSSSSSKTSLGEDAAAGIIPSEGEANEAESPSQNANGNRGQQQPLRTAKPSSVTFLYELYEHEIYNPKTGSWTSRRFTQSPVAGGGGRDSTSLDPQSCAPPRNYLFDSEWKIDMASESRDGFGWEYYIGKYDGLGRRRRRWVRSLMRVGSSTAAVAGSSGSVASAAAALKKKRAVDAKKKTSKSSSAAKSTAKGGALQAVREQYNFKGFGWSFYKSFLFKRSFGASLRIPLSANFDSYDQYRALPYISSSTYFGYPWVVATFLNASFSLDAIKWFIGGMIYKVRWSLAVASALIRGAIEAAVWVILWPWRLWRTAVNMLGILARRVSLGFAKKEELTPSLIDSLNGAVDTGATKSIIESGEGTQVSIETHIEINNSSDFKDNGEVSTASANAVADSPRGGATNIAQQAATPRKKRLTLSGNEIPTFRRTQPIEYSETIQERVGICVSWRMSKQRGYEYRCNFFYSCLPTLLFWRQLEEERKRRIESVRRFIGVWGKRNDPSSARHVGTIEVDKINAEGASTSRLESKSGKSERSMPLSSFLSEHSSALGISAGWPLPVEPHFSLSLLLSLSGFYYGWLLKFIRDLFILPIPKPRIQASKASVLDSYSSPTRLSARSEKLVSFALKNDDKVELIDTDDVVSTVNRTRTEAEENCTREGIAGLSE